MTHIAKLVAVQLLVAAVVSAIVLHVYIRLDEQRTLVINPYPINHFSISMDRPGYTADYVSQKVPPHSPYYGHVSLIYKRPLFQ